MTQAPQTTAERMRNLIFASLTPSALHNPWSEEPGILAAQLAGEIDGLHAEIDAKDAQLEAQAAEMIRFTNLANDFAAASQQLAEARAQIAALTPAAEAYRACVRWENASSYGTQEECAAAWTEYLAATRRAFVPGATP